MWLHDGKRILDFYLIISRTNFRPFEESSGQQFYWILKGREVSKYGCVQNLCGPHQVHKSYFLYLYVWNFVYIVLCWGENISLLRFDIDDQNTMVVFIRWQPSCVCILKSLISSRGASTVKWTIHDPCLVLSENDSKLCIYIEFFEEKYYRLLKHICL